ncbi:MAG: hypothetical protein HY421_02855 [Candidatus Kerfeldbacteria bacterium]|nr:hypothetical protein [Candidatus Kerfeldbacteria bacterium]
MIDRAKNIFASVAATIVTVVFITLITIIADLQLPLKDWLKATFTHHWVGKGVLAAAVFVIVWLMMLSQKRHVDDQRLSRGLMALAWTALVSTVVLFGFFIYETFR